MITKVAIMNDSRLVNTGNHLSKTLIRLFWSPTRRTLIASISLAVNCCSDPKQCPDTIQGLQQIWRWRSEKTFPYQTKLSYTRPTSQAKQPEWPPQKAKVTHAWPEHMKQKLRVSDFWRFKKTPVQEQEEHPEQQIPRSHKQKAQSQYKLLQLANDPDHQNKAEQPH